MRILTERMKGKKVDTLDGIKVFEDARLGAGASRPGRAARPRLRGGQDDEDAAEPSRSEFLTLVEEIVAGTDDELEEA